MIRLALALVAVVGLVGALGPGLTRAAWAELLAQPGLSASVALSLGTGLASAALALGATLLFLAAPRGRARRLVEAWISPLLAAPHAAAALALVLLVAPSGLLPRLLSPWATGWTRPPDLLTTQDPYGLALTLGLVSKEIPFLLFVALAAAPQLSPDRRLAAARALGRPPVEAWATSVAPALYPLIRLPVYAVIAFACSTVDVALVLGPSTPPTLAVRALRWMNDPDLTRRALASAAIALQLLVVALALGLWRLAEIAAWRLTRAWAEGGPLISPGLDRALARFGVGFVGLATLALALAFLAAAVKSIAASYPFPDVLPRAYTAQVWVRAGPGLLASLGAAAALALASTAIALALVVTLLEADLRRAAPAGRLAAALLLAPLLAPQIGFVFGLLLGAEALGLAPGWPTVLAGHVVFVAPYVWLALSQAYLRLDPRWRRVALALGRSEAAVFWRVRAPMLLGPAAAAAAIGVAVSIGQYLPTLLLGGGRVTTVTTEAVALASGADSRRVAIYALAQAAVPALAFAAAIAAPRIVWRRRRGLLEARP